MAQELMVQNFNPDPDAPVAIDYMNPAQGQITMSGNWARRLLDHQLDSNVMRPWVGSNGRTYITRNFMQANGKIKRQNMLVNDNTATLRLFDWQQFDTAVVKAAKPRLKAVADLRKMGLVYDLPNGIAKTILISQTVSDITGATMSMDGLRQSESDRPNFGQLNLPLPIIHKDFQFPLREVLASRTGYSPLDTTTAELAARRVAEQAEQLVLGSNNTLFTGQSSYNWAQGVVWGYKNWPGRITGSLTTPITGGWAPATAITNVLAMIAASRAANHFGPWMLYTGLAWAPYLDNDYKATYNDTSLRSRIRALDGILDCATVDYLDGYDMILVQMTSDIIRLVIGMDITTIQWESHGGMQLNFKVMCVMVPQLRGDYYGQTGLVHYS